MNSRARKLQNILQQLKELEQKQADTHFVLNPANSQKKKKVFVITTEKDIEVVTKDIQAARMRLDDVHNRLSLTLKSGLASESIH